MGKSLRFSLAARPDCFLASRVILPVGVHWEKETFVKDTGIVRQVDELGRIVIPIEIRKRFAIAERDPLQIFVKGDKIILSKPVNACVFCGKTKNLSTFMEREVCRDCRDKVASGEIA
jgi:transcriptional pleiotropic regulator of transition state genes